SDARDAAAGGRQFGRDRDAGGQRGWDRIADIFSRLRRAAAEQRPELWITEPHDACTTAAAATVSQLESLQMPKGLPRECGWQAFCIDLAFDRNYCAAWRPLTRSTPLTR